MTIEEAQEVLLIEEQGLAAVRERIGGEFIKAVELIHDCPSRLIVTGIGKSGIIGQKITATLNSTGTPSFFLHPVEAMHGDLGMVQDTDVIMAISYSGETAELNSLLSNLERRCSSVIAMTGRSDSTLANSADVVLDISVPKEACSLGLAPTTSTTATLALGDALGAPTEFLNMKGIREQFPPDGPIAPHGNPALVTDDTQMALSIVDSLQTHERIDQGYLAHKFAERYESRRGYGASS